MCQDVYPPSNGTSDKGTLDKFQTNSSWTIDIIVQAPIMCVVLMVFLKLTSHKMLDVLFHGGSVVLSWTSVQ